MVGGLSDEEAGYEARRCLSCGNCFECDGCLGACPEDAVIKLGTRAPLPVRLRPLHRLRRLLRAVPRARDRDGRGGGLMRATLDGNEAAASVAYRLNEVCCIYPITPSSPMAELADEWSSQERPNVWGTRAGGGGDAERGRGRGRAARRASGRRAGDDLHRLAGPAADDPEHVQDRRRADPGGDARRGSLARRAGPVDLRRSLRRDGGAPDRLRAAGVGVGAGGARPGGGRAGRHAARRACRSCTSSTASAPRTS